VDRSGLGAEGLVLVGSPVARYPGRVEARHWKESFRPRFSHPDGIESVAKLVGPDRQILAILDRTLWQSYEDIVPMPLENLDTQPTIRWYVLCRLLIEHNFITRCEEGKGQAVERLDDNRKLGAELSRKESAAKLGSHHGTST